MDAVRHGVDPGSGRGAVPGVPSPPYRPRLAADLSGHGLADHHRAR